MMRLWRAYNDINPELRSMWVRGAITGAKWGGGAAAGISVAAFTVGGSFIGGLGLAIAGDERALNPLSPARIGVGALIAKDFLPQIGCFILAYAAKGAAWGVGINTIRYIGRQANKP